MLRKNQKVGPVDRSVEYRISECIGRGGFGDVYLADEIGSRGRSLGQFAMKVMPEDMQAAWVNEVHYGTVFRNDPGVVSLEDSFPWVTMGGGRPQLRWVLVFEFAAGGSLSDYVESHDPWSLTRIRREVASLLDTLMRLHGSASLHRDLTPLNVLVTDTGHLKLADFGIATHRHATGERVRADAFNPMFVPFTWIDSFGATWGEIDDLWQVGQLVAMLATWDTSRCIEVGEVRNLDIDEHLKTVIARSINEHKYAFASAADMRNALVTGPQLTFRSIRSLKGRSVVFTGPMSIKRAEAEKLARRAGAVVYVDPSWQTDTVVVGDRSPLWSGGEQGRKLFRVERLVADGHDIDLVSESTFMRIVRR